MPQPDRSIQAIHQTIETLGNLPGQDPNLIIEMALAMLTDANSDKGLKPVASYVRRYCDVLPGPAAVADISDLILERLF
jgi:hypothetical protein